MNKTFFENYANFTVKSGVNLKPGQVLIIDAPVEAANFARACAKAAFAAGAKDVVLHYADDTFQRLRLEGANDDVTASVPAWRAASYAEYLPQGKPWELATLRIIAPDPEIFKGLPAAKVAAADRARRAALKPFRDSIQNESQWCIVAVPSPAWAKIVFPAIADETEAVEALWGAIFAATRMDQPDPVLAWKHHTDTNMARRDKLNAFDFAGAHLTSGNGTDLTLNFATGAKWEGVLEWTKTTDIPFIANIPTDEIFTTPHRAGVNGKVYGTKPYVHNGAIIKNFCLEFEAGVCVHHSAEVGDDLLDLLIKTDENACRLGEFALVPKSSPINQSGLLFYNTLYDENAACHIALGAAYAENLPEDELHALGFNTSLMHADVMIGADDTTITGTTKDGRLVKIFENGDWAEDFI